MTCDNIFVFIILNFYTLIGVGIQDCIYDIIGPVYPYSGSRARPILWLQL